MRRTLATVQLYLSDFLKLFIGPHEEDSPIHGWPTILGVIGLAAAIFWLANPYM
jgi:hypothetical protein